MISLFPCSADQVFGCQLESLCQREGDTVPSFVRLCVEAVDKKGVFSPKTPKNIPPFEGLGPLAPSLPSHGPLSPPDPPPHTHTLLESSPSLCLAP